MKQVKLNVPYHSQFLEVEDYFWNIRSCGGTCIKMCLDYYSLQKNISNSEEFKNNDLNNNVSILEIMNDAFNNGGYDAQHGFVHNFAVEYFNNHGLESNRLEGLESFDVIKDNLDNANPVVVSIIKRTLEQEKFHLILIVGYEYDESSNEVVNVIYHEPESTDPSRGAYRVCDVDTFLKSWRGKAIFVRNK